MAKMGRPFMRPSERRSAQLVIRITAAERKALEAGARKARVRLSVFIRRLLSAGGR